MSTAAVLCACCLLLCFAPGSWQLSIAELVVPESVEVGGQAELQCRYELGEGESGQGLYVKWWWIPPLSTGLDTKQLYQRIAGRPPVSMQHNVEIKRNDTDTIVLLDMKPTDSGIYECEVSIIDEVREHDELIVYSMGSGPKVNVAVVEDGPDADEEADYLIECQANDVAPTPELVVTIGGMKMYITETVNKTEDGFYSILGSTAVSGQIVNGNEVRCEMFYQNSSISHPSFVDTLTISPAGDSTTTEVPAEVTEADVTPDSLQNLHGSGHRLEFSWILFTAMTIATRMLTL